MDNEGERTVIDNHILSLRFNEHYYVTGCDKNPTHFLAEDVVEFMAHERITGDHDRVESGFIAN